jgi:hypothetical protein
VSVGGEIVEENATDAASFLHKYVPRRLTMILDVNYAPCDEECKSIHRTKSSSHRKDLSHVVGMRPESSGESADSPLRINMTV